MSDDMSRALGHLEGQLAGIVATLARVDERSAARDAAFEGIRHELRVVAADISTLKKQAADQLIVTEQFNALQQAIRDGKNQAKGISKGIGIGIAIASASGGAIVAGTGRLIWNAIVGS